MKLTLKRQKSITSQAESISAWCAVFDWPSIVAAFSVGRHGPARSSAARRKIAARSSHGVRDQSFHASAAAATARSTSARAAVVHRCEHVRALVRLDRLERLAGANLLAADDERDVELLRLHLLEPQAKGFALGRAGCVVEDGLVVRLGGSEDRVCAHEAILGLQGVRDAAGGLQVDGWGVGELVLVGRAGRVARAAPGVRLRIRCQDTIR